MAFYCREQELSKMESLYAGGKFECVIIYGRRRIGKTALINEFCRGKRTIFFSALNSNERENLAEFSKAIYQAEHENADSYPSFGSFDEAFGAVTEMARGERLVLVIDEYPYLARSDESISSRLQHLIDHAWQDTKLYLILCGSSMSFMQRQVLGYESPLYGRRTAQFKLEALTYKETAVFVPNLDSETNAYVYGITGGVPHYINKLNMKGNLRESLLANIFDRSSYLYEEPQNLLKQELRDPSTYNAIISAIANGASKLNEIATRVGLETSACTKYINVLMELEILKKALPYGETKSKRTIYQIDDNFFRFWYRFVSGNIASIASGRIERTIDRLVLSHLHEYMGLIFEKMCREYLLLYARNLPFEITDVGEWWGKEPKTGKELQLDLVAQSAEDKGEFIIGSAKFRNEKIGIGELELIKSYAKVFRAKAKHHFFIFSLGGFTDELLEEEKRGNVTLVALDAMFK